MPIFTIAAVEHTAGKKPIELREESNGLALLADLAETSGGIAFTPADGHGISDAAIKIGAAIHNEYLIGFQPEGSTPGKWRTIQVNVNRPHLRVYSRQGYYSR